MTNRALLTPQLELRKPWLLLDLGKPHQVIGWPVAGPARGKAQHIAWLQVNDKDLPVGVSPASVLRRHARKAGITLETGLMTAARIELFARGICPCMAGTVQTIATVGLGNGERIPRGQNKVPEEWERAGTINVVAILPTPLSFSASLEAISIVTEARTAAILRLDIPDRDGIRPITGTGTDCILIAAPLNGRERSHCGLHTDIGGALADAAYNAVWEAGRTWTVQQNHS